MTGDNPHTPEIEKALRGLYFYDCERTSGNTLKLTHTVVENVIYGIHQEYSDQMTIQMEDSRITAQNPVYHIYGTALNIFQSTLQLTENDDYHTAVYSDCIVNITNSVIESLTGKGRGIYEDVHSGLIKNNQFRNLSIALELNEVKDLVIENNEVMNCFHGFDLETYSTSARIHVKDNLLISSGKILDKTGLGQFGISIYPNSITTSAEFVITGNTLAGFMKAIVYDGYYLDRSILLDLSGNTYRGNVMNLIVEKAMTSEKISTLGSDWGTADPDEVHSRLYQRDILIGSTPAKDLSDAFLFDSPFSTEIANTVYVNPAFSESFADGHLYGHNAFNSLSAGLSFVAPGGTVEVADMTLTQPLWLDRPVNLRASQNEVVFQGIENDPSNSTGLIYVTAPEISLEGFRFENSNYGLVFSEFNLSGYYASSFGAFEVRNCEFYNQTNGAVYYLDYSDQPLNGTLVFNSNLVIRDDKVVSNGSGVYFQSNMERCEISDNHLEGTFYYGLSYNNSLGNDTAVLENNKVVMTSEYPASGISVNSYGTLTLAKNQITSLNKYYESSGIKVYVSGEASRILIAQNAVHGFVYGIQLFGTPGDDTILTLSGTQSYANDFSGNTYGLQTYVRLPNDQPLNAAYNYWGVSDELLDSYILDISDKDYYGPVNYRPTADALPAIYDLSINVGSLSPSFDPDVTNYKASVSYNVDEIEVTADFSGGTLLINHSPAVANKPVKLQLQTGINKIEISYHNGTKTTNYELEVTRQSRPITSESIGNALVYDLNAWQITTPVAGIASFEIQEAQLERGVTLSPNLISHLAEKKYVLDLDFGHWRLELQPSQLSAMALNREGYRVQMLPVNASTMPNGWQTVARIQWRLQSLNTSKSFNEPVKVIYHLTGETFDLEKLSVYSALAMNKPLSFKMDPQQRTLTFKMSPAEASFIVQDSRILSDLLQHWSQRTVAAMAARGIVTGFPDQTYRPDISILRSEAASMLMETLRHTNLLQEVNVRHNFKDVIESIWYAPPIEAVWQAGLLKGFPDQSFRPEEPMTREAFIVAAMSLYHKLTDRQASEALQPKRFSDASSISDWARRDIDEASALGLISGDPSGQLRPKASVSRSEAAQILYSILKLSGW